MGERTVEYEEDAPHVPQADFVEVCFDSNDAAPLGEAEEDLALVRRRSQPLRRELSVRNQARAADFAHETSYGSMPSVVYQQADDGTHGNFFPASYRRILANPAWAARLQKAYTGSRRIAHSASRARRELDCAASSDALLMNVFCHATALHTAPLQSLLGLSGACVPEFGFRARIPLLDGLADRTEIDLRLASPSGDLLIEAKLSETDFQTARPELMHRYPKFASVFAADVLPRSRGLLRSYQLLRSVLVAHHLGARFAVLLDARRTDLVEDIFLVYRAVQEADLRSRLHVLTWQEIAACVPRTLQQFLAEKYGIEPVRGSHSASVGG